VKWRELCGAVHIHSTCSDGSGTVDEILRAAHEAHLDFIVLTDDAKPGACRVEGTGRYDDVLLIVAAEIGSRKAPHVLAFGVKDPAGLDRYDVGHCLAQIRARGGHAFVAHPRGVSSLGMHIPPWRDWDSDAYAGLEVWSYMHDWIEDLRWWRLGSYVLRPESKITGPHPEVLAAWDRVASTRRVSGIGAVDAHAKPLLGKWCKVFPYDVLFRTVLSHVLVEDVPRDAAGEIAAIVEALVAGRCSMAYHVLGDPAPFAYAAVTGSSEVQMGEAVALEERPVLKVTVPGEGAMRLVACGEVASEGPGGVAEFRPTRRGPHRIEVRKGSKPWIFSNPIYVT